MIGNFTILAVNDIPDQLELLKSLLEQAGYRVLTAASGNQGFKLAQTEVPDLIITDVIMPDGDGLALCRLIRSDDKLHSIPILLLSAVGKETPSVVRALEAGADDYLEIPCEPLRLIVKATRLIEHRRTEDALRESENRFRTVFDHAAIGIALVNSDGRPVESNPALQKMLGYTGQELREMSFAEFTHPDDVARDVALAREVFEGKRDHYQLEKRYIKKSGEVVWAILIASVIRSQDGTRGFIVGMVKDITERKQSERALVEANERAIREYDQMLRKLGTLAQTVGTARDLSAIFSAILAFSRPAVPCSALCISLYDQEKSTRQPIYMWYNGREMDVSDLEPIPVAEGSVGQAIRTGEVVVVDDYLEVLNKRGVSVSLGFEEDSREPRSALIAPMKIKGAAIGVIEVQSYEPAAYTQEHVTAMRMAANLAANAIENVRLLEQEQHNSERLRQSQKLESVGRLAGGIAHDFNNMLTAINGYSGMILKQLAKDDPLRPKIEEIKKAGDRSASLTHQLLAFSRKQVLKPKVLDINEAVIDTSKLLRRLIGEDIQLSIIPNPRTGLAKVDPGQLTQVIMNLAVNARDAMPQGGSLSIEIANVYLDENYATLNVPTKAGHYVMLAMTDNGKGMGDETLKYIFEPFFTTKEVGKGTGLGLSTVYGIVKQSGGYIWVESEIGKGSTFKIYLPRVNEVVVQGEKESAPAEVPTGDETILLVEDEEAVRRLARQILEACGYTILEARDGVEALAICSKSDCKIDLLITDVVMPQMGGRELAEKLAQINPHILQLYMSGYTDDAIIHQGMTTAGINFIQKPFTFEDLAQKVRELLDEKAI